MDMYAKEKSYEEYRLTGVHRILLDIPDKTEEVKMVRFLHNLEFFGNGFRRLLPTTHLNIFKMPLILLSHLSRKLHGGSGIEGLRNTIVKTLI